MDRDWANILANILFGSLDVADRLTRLRARLSTGRNWCRRSAARTPLTLIAAMILVVIADHEDGHCAHAELEFFVAEPVTAFSRGLDLGR
jgi:hypothetical protein